MTHVDNKTVSVNVTLSCPSPLEGQTYSRWHLYTKQIVNFRNMSTFVHYHIDSDDGCDTKAHAIYKDNRNSRSICTNSNKNSSNKIPKEMTKVKDSYCLYSVKINSLYAYLKHVSTLFKLFLQNISVFYPSNWTRALLTFDFRLKLYHSSLSWNIFRMLHGNSLFLFLYILLFKVAQCHEA